MTRVPEIPLTFVAHVYSASCVSDSEIWFWSQVVKIETFWRCFDSSLRKLCFRGKKNSRYYSHITEIIRQYYRNITWKYCKIAKIFWNLSLILLKCCNDLAMFAHNMTYAIFSKYCQNYPHSTVILRESFENIPLKFCNIATIFIKLLERFLKYYRNLVMSVQNIMNEMLLQY